MKGETEGLIDPPHPRETGILISTSDAGIELRLHKDETTGLVYANTWRPWASPILRAKEERWICSVCWGLKREEWIAIGEKLKEVTEAPR